MPVRQCCADLPRTPMSRLAAGQMAVHDLHAGSSIVAAEGAVQLHFRDHALAWLGDAVPLTSITLDEGERFVTPQRGIVSIRATHAHAAAFVVLPSHANQGAYGFIRQAAHHLAGLVRTRLRRAA